MNFFNPKPVTAKKGTTEGFYFGEPEAEAEIIRDGQKLSDFFEDFFDIHNEICNGKFIISGRKGAGKSAIARHYKSLSENPIHRVYTSIVTPKDIELDKVIQGLPGVDPSLIFEWNILTKLVRLIIDANLTEYANHISDLKKFYNRNTGVMNIANYKIDEMSTKTEVGADLFRNSFGGILAKVFKEKKFSKAPFYEFIPTLREILKTVLNYDVYKDVVFLIEFDELDIDFKINRDSNKILDLIRVARSYNTDIFKDTPFKLLIFIRDDIREHICSSDRTKLFDSYEYTINWYKYDDFSENENNIKLRQFINKRIAANFEKLSLQYNKQDPWQTLFVNTSNDYTGKTAFSYILDYTFYRPRDFVNLLSPLTELKFSYPLSRSAVIVLINKLAHRTIGDIKDELSILYDKQYIQSIENTLKEISNSRPPISYDALTQIFCNHNIDIKDLDLLIDYDLIIPSKKNCFMRINS